MISGTREVKAERPITEITDCISAVADKSSPLFVWESKDLKPDTN